MNDDPKRLIDPDSRSSPGVRVLLRIARADVPSEDRIAGIESGLAAFLALPAGAATHGGAATGGAGGGAALAGLKAATAAKVGGAVVLATLGAVTAAYLETRGTTRVPAPTTAPAQGVSPSRISEPSVAPIPSVLEPGRNAVELERAPPPPPPASSTTAPPQAVASASERGSNSEIALLNEAQDAVASDPASALSLANQHTARFPQGMLAQEREVIAIEALLRLGRSDEARLRARRFHRTYPSSGHWPRIETLLSEAEPHNP